MSHDVFISYSAHDKTVADAVCATLENRKIRCWIAPRDVLPGVPYAEALIDGINKSRLVVLVFSNDSNQSPQVMREVERAVNKGIPIITLRIEDVTPSKSMEYFLSAPHWLDALTPPLEQHLQKLASTVELLLSSETPLQNNERLPEKTAFKTKTKYKVKLVYIAFGLVVVALFILVVFLAKGSFDGIFKNSITGRLDSGSPVGATTPTFSSSLQGLPSQTITSLNASSSTVAPTTEVSKTQSVVTTTGIINTSDQLISGGSTSGTLKQGETQWYSFNAVAGDAVFAILSKGDSSSKMEPSLELLGTDGNSIIEGWGNISYSINQGITKPGKYTFAISDNTNIGGNYVLSFMQLSKSVNPLTSGVSLQGKLQVSGDVNWYTFDAVPGDAVYAILSKGDSSSKMEPSLELLGTDGNSIIEGWGNISYSINQGITKPGKYTLRVTDNANGAGNYVLSFMQLSKSVNPLTSGVSLQGQLQVSGDVNWYTFDAVSSDAVYAMLSKGENSSTMQPFLDLLGTDGNPIIGGWGNISYSINQDITKSGKYTLRVTDNANGAGNYVLSFMQLSKPVNTLSSGVSLQGQLKVSGDVNWYTFDALAGDAVSVVLSQSSNSSTMQPFLDLLGPDGNPIVGGWGNTSFTIDQGITKPGKYTLRVTNNANTAGNYVLSFHLLRQ